MHSNDETPTSTIQSDVVNMQLTPSNLSSSLIERSQSGNIPTTSSDNSFSMNTVISLDFLQKLAISNLLTPEIILQLQNGSNLSIVGRDQSTGLTPLTSQCPGGMQSLNNIPCGLTNGFKGIPSFLPEVSRTFSIDQQQRIVQPSYSQSSQQQQQLNNLISNNYMPTDDAFFNVDLIKKDNNSENVKKSTPENPTKNQSNKLAAKCEPGCSPDSQPTTPVTNDRRNPPCSICGTDSTGIHFGVDACAACSAFFRRTVVLNKQYTCTKGGSCTISKDNTIGQKCRACRFNKCLNSGMDKNSVQHRRDAIGKYSSVVKRENSLDNDDNEPPAKIGCINSNEPSTSNGFVPSPMISTQIPAKEIGFQREPKSILNELLSRQKVLMNQRQLLYSDDSIEDWFTNAPPLGEETVSELSNFTNCMYHLWKVEPRIAAEFINKNRYLEKLPTNEKKLILKNFVVIRQAVEEPYLTWKLGGMEKNHWIMTNRKFIDINNIDKYFHNGTFKGLNLDSETTKKLLVPSISSAMENVGKLMKKFRITEIEMVALLGLTLLDPAVTGIDQKTRILLKTVRDQLIQDIFEHYEDEAQYLEPEIRLADLFMILTAIRIHSNKTSENMQLLKIFELIPPDKCFSQLLELEIDSNSSFGYQADSVHDIPNSNR